MGKRNFDLSAMMDTVSKLDTNPGPPVQMIPLDDILTNKANFYKVDTASLKPLADSIAMDGLQQYPVVMPHPEQEGKYLLLSGHRRCAAIRMLVKDKDHPREDLRLVPCTVRQYQSEAMAELQLILANSTARVLTNAEISKQAERMEILLYQLKEEGYTFPERMRDQVAAACKVSAPKLARLKVIREKLKAPEFLLLFEKDKLPEQTAYALARLPEDFQKRLAGLNVDLSGNTTGSLACLGCGYERGCSIHGCAVVNLAVQEIQSLAQENKALQTRLNAEHPAEVDAQAVIDFLRKADLKGGRRVAADVVIETLERRTRGNDEAIQ